MTKTATAEVQRNTAKRQLFGARQALVHLVELYDKGQWRLYYKEDTFAEAVRSEARRRTLDAGCEPARQLISAGCVKSLQQESHSTMSAFHTARL